MKSVQEAIELCLEVDVPNMNVFAGVLRVAVNA